MGATRGSGGVAPLCAMGVTGSSFGGDCCSCKLDTYYFIKPKGLYKLIENKLIYSTGYTVVVFRVHFHHDLKALCHTMSITNRTLLFEITIGDVHYFHVCGNICV